MAELMTAKSYRNGKIVKQYEKGGKPYATIKIPCDRCVKGVYAIGVENGQIKPHPVANGVCFKCGGLGYELKDVRLYTEKELETMEKANEAAKAKRMAEQKKKLEAEFNDNRIKWLDENGFNADEVTYIYAGADSYQIKDELKDAGFRFSSTLKWHKATRDEKYADNLIEVKLGDIAEWSAWGKANFNRDSQKIVEEKIAATQPKVESNWIGEVGDKITDLKVQLVRKTGFFGKYGWTNIYKFQYEKNIYIWMTSTNISEKITEGMEVSLSGIVKSHTLYKGEHQTNLKRCKIKIWEN